MNVCGECKSDLQFLSTLFLVRMAVCFILSVVQYLYIETGEMENVELARLGLVHKRN